MLGGELDGSWNEPTGWALASLHGAPFPQVEKVVALSAALSAPLLVAYIADSDFAFLQFTAPGLEPRVGVLHPDVAAEMGVDGVPRAEQTYADLVRWAGVPLEEPAVTGALTQQLTFAEDSFLVLANSVGAFPPGTLEEYVFGSLDPVA